MINHYAREPHQDKYKWLRPGRCTPASNEAYMVLHLAIDTILQWSRQLAVVEIQCQMLIKQKLSFSRKIHSSYATLAMNTTDWGCAAEEYKILKESYRLILENDDSSAMVLTGCNMQIISNCQSPDFTTDR